MKALQLYEEQLTRSSEHVPDGKKSGDHWIQGWKAEYNASLHLPNYQLIQPMDMKQGMLDFIKNVLRACIWFKSVVDADIPIASMDQMPLRSNETSGQKILKIWDQDIVVKQNYYLTHGQIMCLTILSSKDGVISSHHVFKGRSTHLQDKLNRPPGVVTLWSAKGSYQVQTKAETIWHLPNLTRHDALTEWTYKEWQLMLLDDYFVPSKVWQELLKLGYVRVVLGGGITGYVQINDTHLHHRLKSIYCKKESKLMMEQLEARPDRTPSPSRCSGSTKGEFHCKCSGWVWRSAGAGQNRQHDSSHYQFPSAVHGSSNQ